MGFQMVLLPCPRCKSEDVEWTNSRDLDILTNYVSCNNCDLTTFRIETTCFINLPNLDYETTVLKYNAWVMTNPTRYYDEDWSRRNAT